MTLCVEVFKDGSVILHGPKAGELLTLAPEALATIIGGAIDSYRKVRKELECESLN